MPDNIQDEVKKSLHAIFADPATASRIASLAVSKRPPGVSIRCNLPYYKEYYAHWLKVQVDKMILSKETLVFEYRIFCSDGDMSKLTLYNKVNQALRYLIDNMDDADSTYANFRKIIRIHRTHPKYEGVVIEFIPEIRFQQTSADGRFVVPKEDTTPKWRTEMDDWLESDSKKSFLREKLCLTREEIVDLKSELVEIRGLMFNVDATKIQIMKVNV